MEGIGFSHFWGFSPAIDFFRDTKIDLKSDQPLNILISETSDIRHVLKSLTDNLPTRTAPITLYFHEKEKENIARAILFLTILSETHLSYRERQEYFLDLYGNVTIRDKTAAYLENVTNELI